MKETKAEGRKKLWSQVEGNRESDCKKDEEEEQRVIEWVKEEADVDPLPTLSNLPRPRSRTLFGAHLTAKRTMDQSKYPSQLIMKLAHGEKSAPFLAIQILGDIHMDAKKNPKFLLSPNQLLKKESSCTTS